MEWPPYHLRQNFGIVVPDTTLEQIPVCVCARRDHTTSLNDNILSYSQQLISREHTFILDIRYLYLVRIETTSRTGVRKNNILFCQQIFCVSRYSHTSGPRATKCASTLRAKLGMDAISHACITWVAVYAGLRIGARSKHHV